VEDVLTLERWIAAVVPVVRGAVVVASVAVEIVSAIEALPPHRALAVRALSEAPVEA